MELETVLTAMCKMEDECQIQIMLNSNGPSIILPDKMRWQAIIVDATSMNFYRHETLIYVPPIGRVVFLFVVRNETRQYNNRFYILLNVECKLY